MVGRGRLTLDSGKPTFMSSAQDRHHRTSGGRPPGSNSPWKGWIYRLAPEAPAFLGMPTGPEAFLELQSVSGLRPYARTHLKEGLLPHSSGRRDERQIPTRQPGSQRRPPISRWRIDSRPKGSRFGWAIFGWATISLTALYSTGSLGPV